MREAIFYLWTISDTGSIVWGSCYLDRIEYFIDYQSFRSYRISHLTTPGTSCKSPLSTDITEWSAILNILCGRFHFRIYSSPSLCKGIKNLIYRKYIFFLKNICIFEKRIYTPLAFRSLSRIQKLFEMQFPPLVL